MSFKIVRDRNEAWCRANGVPGQWRTSPDPLAALLRKLFEELGEYAEAWDPAELHDLADVLEQLLALTDPDGTERQRGRVVCTATEAPFRQMAELIALYAVSRHPGHLHAARLALRRELACVDPVDAAGPAHEAKVAQMGGFGDLVEWCPVPAAIDLGYLSLPAEVQADIEQQAGSRRGGSLNPTPDCGSNPSPLPGPRRGLWFCQACREFHEPDGTPIETGTLCRDNGPSQTGRRDGQR
jgi:predicted house-cleaning noncanonical NTP pyrophosphatase (MazG superfamily)